MVHEERSRARRAPPRQVGWTEIGAAWSKRTDEGRDYLSLSSC
ncbi:DUF736 family protein [Bradyrhizobium brasilense]